MSVTDRLGVVPFGTKNPLVGNFLLYPRRIILEVLRLALQEENLFDNFAEPGTVRDRNQFLLKYDSAGNLSPDSLIVLSDSGSEKLVRGDNRPRLSVERGAGQFTQTPLSRTREVWPGARHSSDVFDSTVEINCHSSKKLESELLAMVVSGIVLYFQNTIREKSALMYISAPRVEATSAEAADSEVVSYNTKVILQVSQPVSWVTKLINPTIANDVKVSIETLTIAI